MNSISIVIPAFNEDSRLPDTLRAVFGYLSETQPDFAEVIVVDDGSTDLTCAIVERLVPLYAGLRLVKNPGNRGKGYSVRHGV
ncbi:MAG TPA: glycosyltransferase, partial [Bryobacteraceae bacterium]|nr:glycosyltransferase [Bryobacteraceae bacterium]